MFVVFVVVPLFFSLPLASESQVTISLLLGSFFYASAETYLILMTFDPAGKTLGRSKLSHFGNFRGQNAYFPVSYGTLVFSSLK